MHAPKNQPEGRPTHRCEPGAGRFSWRDSPLAQEFFVIHNLSMRLGDRLVAPLGLTSSRWLLLGALSRHEEAPSLSDLSGDALLSVQNVSRMVAAMEEDGLVERFTVEGRGRTVFVRMTERGAGVREAALAAARLFSSHMLDGIPRARVERMASDLEAMIGNLEGLLARLESGEIDPAEEVGADGDGA